MTDTQQNRVQAGVPTGGQFATQNRSEADITLATAQGREPEIALTGSYTLADDMYDPLPPYPAQVGTAEVTVTFDTQPETQIDITQPDGTIQSVMFWSSDDDGWNHNTLDSGTVEDEDVSTADALFGSFEDPVAVRREFVRWGEKVHSRVVDTVWGITLNAVDDHARKAIGAYAADQPIPEDRGRARISADVELNTHRADLPLYPENLPPVTDVSFTPGSDHPGTIYVTLTTEDGNAVSVWVDDDGDAGDSIHNNEEPTGWDEEDENEFLDYAHAVRERIAADAERVREIALDQARAAIVANALRR